jgi:hypothetical protein
MEWKRLPRRYIPLSYALPSAYPVSDRKDRVSLVLLEGWLRERRTVSPDTVMVGIGNYLEMTSCLNSASGAEGQYYSFGRIILVLDMEGFLCMYNPLHFGLQQVWDVNTPKQSKWLFAAFPAIDFERQRHIRQ